MEKRKIAVVAIGGNSLIKNEKNVATVITQVLVDKSHLAFQHPSKPIGGFMGEMEAREKEKDLELNHITLAEAKRYLEEGTHFAKGSMAPTIQAVIWYLEAGGKEAIITNPENIGKALRGETGTHITT